MLYNLPVDNTFHWDCKTIICTTYGVNFPHEESNRKKETKLSFAAVVLGIHTLPKHSYIFLLKPVPDYYEFGTFKTCDECFLLSFQPELI